MDAYYVNMRLAGEEKSEFVSSPLHAGEQEQHDGVDGGPVRRRRVRTAPVYQFPNESWCTARPRWRPSRTSTRDITQLSLWSQRGTSVIRKHDRHPRGERDTLRAPLYLRAENSELPELKRVITSTGGRVVGRHAGPLPPEAPRLPGTVSALGKGQPEASSPMMETDLRDTMQIHWPLRR